MKLPKGFKIVGPHDFYPFQYESFLFGIERQHAGLLLDLGLGKTRTAIDIARYRMQFTTDIRRLLVVCPTSVMFNWEKECNLYSEYKTVVLHGDKDERLARLKLKRPKFFIINYEYLYPLLMHLDIIEKVATKDEEYNELMKKCEHYRYRGNPIMAKEYLNKAKIAQNDIVIVTQLREGGRLKVQNLGFDMIIFDETARYLKSHDTNRTKASQLLAGMSKHNLILTATPIANRPLDLFAQFLVMDGGKSFTSNFWRFRNGFFKNVGRGRWQNWVLKQEKVPLMRQRIYSSCIRFKKSEVLPDLPPIINKEIVLRPSPEFTAQYSEMEEQVLSAIAIENSGRAVVSVDNILTKLLRLQQLTSGFAKDRNTGVEEKTAITPKLDALVEQVELIIDAEESVVIWCRFHKTLDLIEHALLTKKINCVTMSGKDNSKMKYAKWNGYQKNADIPVFIGQVESGGIGIELFKEDGDVEKSQYMIFYENVWSLDIRQQAEGRIHRIGQFSTCVYIDILMEGTIDERILKVLKQNKAIADFVLDFGIKIFLKGE